MGKSIETSSWVQWCMACIEIFARWTGRWADIGWERSLGNFFPWHFCLLIVMMHSQQLKKRWTRDSWPQSFPSVTPILSILAPALGASRVECSHKILRPSQFMSGHGFSWHPIPQCPGAIVMSLHELASGRGGRWSAHILAPRFGNHGRRGGTTMTTNHYIPEMRI